MYEEIKNIVNLVLKNNKYLFIDLEIRGDKKLKILDIFVDSVSELDLNKLSDLNREIWNEIVKSGLSEKFSKITVSSPGIDRSFKYIQQLPKHIGRELEIKLNNGSEISGTLENVDEKKGLIEIMIKAKKKDIKENISEIIDFKNIRESKVKLKF
jgi:ribosome maturation factor RimP